MIALVAALGFGYTAGAIAEAKGRPFGWFFLIGFVLPVVGVIVAVAAGPAEPPPAGD
jgi:hypothetical protein